MSGFFRRVYTPTYLVASVVSHLELSILLVASPFLLFPKPAYSPVMLVVPLLWLAWRIYDGRFVPSTPYNTAVGLLLVMLLVNLYVIDIDVSLRKVTGIILQVAFFYGVIRAIRRGRDFRWAVGLFVAAGVALSLVALIGTAWAQDVKIAAVNTLTRMFPLLIRNMPGAEKGAHPNAVAGSLIWFVPLQISLLVYLWHDEKAGAWRSGRFRVLAASTLATGLILFFTQSRGAWVGVIIGLLGMGVMYYTYRGGKWRGTLLLLYIAFVLFVILFNTMLVLYLPLDMGDFGGLKRKIITRQDLWVQAVRIISDHPLTGAGLNSFSPLLHTPEYAPSIARVINTHPHNALLLVGVEMGIPGMVGYAALWVAAFIIALKVGLKSSDGYLRAVGQGLMGGIIASLLFGVTDAIPLGSKVCLFMWLAFALLQAARDVDSAA